MDKEQLQNTQTAGSSKIEVPATSPNANMGVVAEQTTPLPNSPGSAAAEKEFSSCHREFSHFVHEYVREYIQLADQKAGFVFAASSALLAFLYNENFQINWLIPIDDWKLLSFLSFGAMILLAVATLFSLFTLIPRTSGSRRGLIFWDAIPECNSGKDYCEEVINKTPTSLITAELEHTYELSKVCREKYRALKISILTLFFGMAATVYLLLSAPSNDVGRNSPINGLQTDSKSQEG